jgi:hypothetical protein
MDVPRIGVFPRHNILGIGSVHGPHLDKQGVSYTPVKAEAVPIDEALEREWDGDAHFVGYHLVEDEGRAADMPRLRKEILGSLEREGVTVELSCLALDWDTPGHVPLTEKYLLEFCDKLAKVRASDPELDNVYAWYTSRAGARVVYVLDTPVGPDEFEARLGTLLYKYQSLGMEVDMSCRDWTRLYRLPKVRRDGKRTSKAPCFCMGIEGRLLDIKAFEAAPAPRATRIRGPVSRSRSRMPSQEECMECWEEEGKRGPRQSAFITSAKKALKGLPYHDIIFGETPLPDTNRNNYLMRMLGVLIPALIPFRASEVQIFSLLYNPLIRLEPDEGTPDWHEHVWGALKDIYAREAAKLGEDEQQRLAEAVRGGEVIQSMVKGMSEWCDAEELKGTPEQAAEFVKQRVFANMGKYYYPLLENGYYGPLCLVQTQLVPRIRKTYLAGIVDTFRMGAQGKLVSVPVNDVVNEHSTCVHEVRMTPLQTEGGTVFNMDGEKPILTLPMYRRRADLQGVFDPDVDGWLRAWFEDNYDAVAKWIGYALAFEDGPICALSITGPAGTGKKLLASGLSECLTDPEYATGEDVTGTFNGKFLQTPFLHINEGWPKTATGKSPSDVFKGMTAGDAISVREIYKPRVNVLNPIRMILTANDHDLLYELTRGKDLSPESRDAIGQRILHFDTGDGAVEYLRRLGGTGFTSSPGSRWIRGDNGEPSDYVVAKHFLWLYQNRPSKDPSQRFCVMGNCGKDSQRMYHMSTQGEHIPHVLNALACMIEKLYATSFKEECIRTPEGNVYVTLGGVLRCVRDFLEVRMTEKSFQTAFRCVVATTIPREFEGRKFYRINLGMVYMYADQWGLDTARMKSCLKQQEMSRCT